MPSQECLKTLLKMPMSSEKTSNSGNKTYVKLSLSYFLENPLC